MKNYLNSHRDTEIIIIIINILPIIYNKNKVQKNKESICKSTGIKLFTNTITRRRQERH